MSNRVLGVLVASLAFAGQSSPDPVPPAAESLALRVDVIQEDPRSLQQLIASCEHVVFGRATANASFLAKGGQFVGTRYRVDIDESIKGNLAGSIQVVIAGGRVRLPDGTDRQINAASFVPPLDGDPYVWFLRLSPELSGYVLCADGLGLFRTNRSGYVRTSGGTTPLAREIVRSALTMDNFRALLRRLVKSH